MKKESGEKITQAQDVDVIRLENAYKLKEDRHIAKIVGNRNDEGIRILKSWILRKCGLSGETLDSVWLRKIKLNWSDKFPEWIKSEGIMDELFNLYVRQRTAEGIEQKIAEKDYLAIIRESFNIYWTLYKLAEQFKDEDEKKADEQLKTKQKSQNNRRTLVNVHAEQ